VRAVPAPAPFLRWAGGKRRLLPALLAARPTDFGGYFEPFVGGGALLFALPPSSRRVVNDANAQLVAAYRVLRDDTDTLVRALRVHAADTSKDAYLRLRASEPHDAVGIAARFIALNRLSFNGLYRVNRAGRYNVPWGALANPTVCNEELLRADAASLAGVEVRCGSFADAVADAVAGDFVYLDPPYIPASATSSFTAYAAEGFGLTEQRQLAEVIADLDARSVHVMLSNSDTPVTREVFAALQLHTVSVRRSISAKASARGTVTEVIGVNYPVEQMHDPTAFAALTASAPA
jgi:DNA adenine methylase